MLSYAHGVGAEPLLGETIGANLDRTIARVPDADALVSVHQDIRYTYAEFGEAVDRLAGGMLAAGLDRGDPPAEPPGSRRARRSPTTTSSTTRARSRCCSATASLTASASRSRCTTASGW